jgi:hypothetical protein
MSMSGIAVLSQVDGLGEGMWVHSGKRMLVQANSSSASFLFSPPCSSGCFFLFDAFLVTFLPLARFGLVIGQRLGAQLSLFALNLLQKRLVFLELRRLGDMN